MRQPLVVLLEARKQRVHVLELRQTWRALTSLLQLNIFMLHLPDGFLVHVQILAHFVHLVFVHLDFLLELLTLVTRQLSRHQCVLARGGRCSGLHNEREKIVFEPFIAHLSLNPLAFGDAEAAVVADSAHVGD